MDQVSSTAKKILDGLTKRQRRAIRKGNPFKVERNDTIRTLKARGLKVELLSEISGLSQSTVFRILKTTSKSSHNAPDDMNGTLKSLKGVFDALYKAVALILNKGQEKR